MGYNGFQTARKDTPRQHHSPSAPQAFQPDIRSQADNLPFITTAWVRFAQPDLVIDVKFG